MDVLRYTSIAIFLCHIRRKVPTEEIEEKYKEVTKSLA